MAMGDVNKLIQEIEHASYRKGYEDGIAAVVKAASQAAASPGPAPRGRKPKSASPAPGKRKPGRPASKVSARKVPAAKSPAKARQARYKSRNGSGSMTDLVLGFVKENPGLASGLIVTKLREANPTLKEKTIQVYLSRLKTRGQLYHADGRWHASR